MAAGRSRSVLLVSLLASVCALLVALWMGSLSLAEDSAPPVVKAPAAPAPRHEIASLRTATSRTYAMEDGTRATKIWSSAVNYKDGSGGWRGIDTNLRAAGGGALKTASSAVPVTLPASLSAPATVAHGSRWVGFALRGASGTGAPSVSGTTATYDDALRGVDVEYQALATGVKETLKLADPAVPSSYRFALSSSAGLTAHRRADGAVAFRDAGGVERFVLPSPTVQQAGDPAPMTKHVTYRLSRDADMLTVVIDRRWLASARFPVVVDPSTFANWGDSCTLDSATPATSNCNGTTWQLGHSASGTKRAGWHLVDFGGIPRTASIIHANLYAYWTGQTASTADPAIDAYEVTGHQLDDGANWNTYDGTHAWTTAGGDMAATPAASETIDHTWGTGVFVQWDLSAAAQRWIRAGGVDNGIILRAHDETAANVVSLEGLGGANGPFLMVFWARHPGAERDATLEGQGIDDRSSWSVNVASGNLAVAAHDLTLPGVAGSDLSVDRAYNSSDAMADFPDLGTGWTLGINGAPLTLEYVFPSNAQVLRTNSGAVYRFDPGATAGTYVTPPGIDADLAYDAGTAQYTLTMRQSGIKWVYGSPPGSTNHDEQLLKVVDRHGNTIAVAWSASDPSEKVDHITDTFGRNLNAHYDANGRLDSFTQPATGGTASRVWRYSQSATSGGHQLDWSKNPDLKQTQYFYNTTSGLLTRLTDARGHDVTFGYGGTSGASQGASDQITSVTRAVDATSAHDLVWRWNYTPASGTGDACTAANVIARTVETDPEGHLTTYCYNADGQVIQVFDANHRSTKSTYNAQGNVAQFTGLAGTANPSLTTYSFSTANPTNATGSSTQVGANTQSTTISYCGDSGQPSCGTNTYAQFKYLRTADKDTQGTQQAFEYNATGDLTHVTTPSGSDSQTLTYDAHGNVATGKDGNLNQTTYTWTSDFLTKVQPPVPLAAENFAPDGISRVKWGQDGNGVYACMTYDGEDRTTRVDWKTGLTGGDCATGTTSKWMTFTYDDDGNLSQRADNAGNTTIYTYDYANRRTGESFPSSRSNTYAYDRAGNLVSLTDNDGATSYTYDPANRLKTVTSPKPGTGTSTITYDYTDPATSTDPSKQTISFPGGLKQESTIDAAGNVTSIKALNGSTVLDKRDYSHLLTVGGVTTVSALTQTMTDNAGNVTTYTPGAANRLKDVVTTNGSTPVEDWHYAYDAAGNRTLRQHRVGTGSMVNTGYGYNAANQLCFSVAAAPTGSCASPPTGATTYAYDNDGQRATNPAASFDAIQRLTTLGGTSLSYLSPGNAELVAYGTAGYQNNVLGLGRLIPPSGSATDLIHTPSGATIAQRVGTTSKQNLFTDALGSVFATADDGATTLSKQYKYDPDGNATGTGTGTTPSVLYANGVQVGGLYHYGARFYDPSTAMWTQQDPLNQIGSLTQANRYGYAGGDPVDNADPTGLVLPPPDPCSGPLCLQYSPHQYYAVADECSSHTCRCKVLSSSIFAIPTEVLEAKVVTYFVRLVSGVELIKC